MMTEDTLAPPSRAGVIRRGVARTGEGPRPGGRTRRAHPARTPRAGASRSHSLLLSLAPAIALLLLWELVARLAGSQFFPPPSQIVVRAWELWFSGPITSAFTTERFWADVVPSMGRALFGWLVAAAIGIAVGSIAGRWAGAAAYIDPPVNFIRSLPKPALVPIFLIILGGTDAMRLAFIVFGCIWPVLLNTMQSVRAIDPTYHETAKAFHIRPLRTFAAVFLPAASPGVVAGMRVSLSLALILMVISEWMLATSGLGFFLLDAQRRFQITDLWAAMLVLGIAGYLLNVLFVAVEHRLLRWHRAVTLQS